MNETRSIYPEPIRYDKCGCILIEQVYLDEKGNTAVDAHGRFEDIRYDSQKDEHRVKCPECNFRQKISLPAGYHAWSMFRRWVFSSGKSDAIIGFDAASTAPQPRPVSSKLASTSFCTSGPTGITVASNSPSEPAT